MRGDRRDDPQSFKVHTFTSAIHNDRRAVKRLADQGGRCFLCLRPMKISGASRDHVIPTSKGGVGDYRNVAISHEGCNNTKGDREPTEDEILRFKDMTGAEPKRLNSDLSIFDTL